MRDVLEVLSDWFEQVPQQHKLDATASPTDVAAGTGRGYFSVPAKEVFEVSQACSGLIVGTDIRLAAKSVSTTADHCWHCLAEPLFPPRMIG